MRKEKVTEFVLLVKENLIGTEKKKKKIILLLNIHIPSRCDCVFFFFSPSTFFLTIFFSSSSFKTILLVSFINMSLLYMDRLLILIRVSFLFSFFLLLLLPIYNYNPISHLLLFPSLSFSFLLFVTGKVIRESHNGFAGYTVGQGAKLDGM